MSEPLEIHLKDGLCKVFQGEARRVFYATEESVGLALLKLNSIQVNQSVQWIDVLGTHGIAIGVTGHKTVVMMMNPAQERKVAYFEDNQHVLEFTAIFPLTFLAMRMDHHKLVRAQLYVVKPGGMSHLSITSDDRLLTAFPYGNVYHNGVICWGSVETGHLRYADVENVFFTSPFNRDLWAPATLGIGDASLPDLITRVVGILPTPPAEYYEKSIAAVVQEILR